MKNKKIIDGEQKETGEFSRRDFLVGAGSVLAAGAVGGGLLAGCKGETTTTTKTVEIPTTKTVSTTVEIPTTITSTATSTTTKTVSGTGGEITTTVTVPNGEGTIDWLGQPAVINPSDIDEIIDTEVVVVGGGHSGQFAACAAAEEGAEVVLIESESHFEAHSFQYGAIGSKYCKDAGIDVDPNEVLREMIRTEQRINTRLVSRLLHNVGPTFDWWYDLFTDDIKNVLELVFWPLPEHYDPSHDLYRHFPSGVDFAHEHYVKAIGCVEARNKELGVDLRYRVRADQLVTTGTRVTGIIAEKADGGYLQVNASKGVILATGEWSGNATMQNALNPAGVWLKKKLGLVMLIIGKVDDFTKARRTMGEGQKMACWVGGGCSLSLRLLV